MQTAAPSVEEISQRGEQVLEFLVTRRTAGSFNRDVLVPQRCGRNPRETKDTVGMGKAGGFGRIGPDCFPWGLMKRVVMDCVRRDLWPGDTS